MSRTSRVWHERLRAECGAIKRVAGDRRALVPEDTVAVGLLHAVERIEQAINDLTSPVQYLSLAEWGLTQTPAVPRHTVRRWVEGGRFQERDLLRRGSIVRLRAGAMPKVGRVTAEEEAA